MLRYIGGLGSTMAVNRDQLFGELEALTEAEIEAGLDAGVWGEDKRQLVEHYLDQLKLTTMQFEAATTRGGVGGGSSREEGNLDSACSLHHRGGGNDRSDGIGVRRLPGSSELDLVSANGFHQLEPQSVVGINWHQGTNLNFDL
jgi:hypothetical protein